MLVVLLTLLAFQPARCDKRLLREDPLLHAVFEEIRWNSYWLRLDGEDLSRGRGVTVHTDGRYAGYCVDAWSRCQLFTREGNSPVLVRVSSSSSVSETALGIWRIEVQGWERRRVLSVQDEDTPALPVGKEEIRDPVSADELLMGRHEIGTLRLTSCVVDKGDLGSMTPTAIRERRRPKTSESLIKAIREQNLHSTANRIVVPYFADTDRIVFLKLEGGSGAERLAAIRRAADWWTFSPIENIEYAGRPEAAGTIARSVELSVMVILMADGSEIWSK